VNLIAGQIEPGLLATFIAVADRKSVFGGADVMHLSQPAVTAQIKKTEDGLGASLFLRSVQGMRLTPKGAQLYSYAREIARLLAEAQSAVAEGKELAGRLKIAASTTIASYVLPALLTAFCRTYPRIELELSL
jgi:DNA-binding transcriptional LysR family regulator